MSEQPGEQTAPNTPEPRERGVPKAPEPLTLEEREMALITLAGALLRSGGASEQEVAHLALKIRIDAAATPDPEGQALAALVDALLRADPDELAEVRGRLARIAAFERARIDSADAEDDTG